MKIYTVALFVAVASPPAFAAPIVTTDAAGVVHASAVVPAPPEKVLAIIRDPVAMHAISNAGGTLRATPSDPCIDVSYLLENPLVTIAYVARACPTPTGFRTDLVQSDSFASMTAEWVVRPVDGGSEVAYVYRQDLNIPVPDWMIRKRTEASITAMMTALVGQLGG